MLRIVSLLKHLDPMASMNARPQPLTDLQMNRQVRRIDANQITFLTAFIKNTVINSPHVQERIVYAINQEQNSTETKAWVPTESYQKALENTIRTKIEEALALPDKFIEQGILFHISDFAPQVDGLNHRDSWNRLPGSYGLLFKISPSESNQDHFICICEEFGETTSHPTNTIQRQKKFTLPISR